MVMNPTPAPKHETRRLLVELDDHIRVFAEPEHAFPGVVECQMRVIGPELAGLESGRKDPSVEIGLGAHADSDMPIKRARCGHLFRRHGDVVNPHLVDEAVE